MIITTTLRLVIVLKIKKSKGFVALTLGAWEVVAQGMWPLKVPQLSVQLPLAPVLQGALSCKPPVFMNVVWPVGWP